MSFFIKKILLFAVFLIIAPGFVNKQLEDKGVQADVKNLLQKKPKGIVISLGRSCGVARKSKKYGLREYSFPFDWIITPFEDLCAIIQNDFEDFFNFEVFTRWVEEKQLINKRYHLYFPHEPINMEDWVESPQGLISSSKIAVEDYHKTKEKYERRIARFYAVLNSGLRVYLVREDITTMQTIELYNLLKTKFPEANFTLIGIEKSFKEGNWSINEANLKYFPVEPDERESPPGAASKRVIKKLSADLK